MKLLKIYVLYRLQIIVALIIVGVLLHIYVDTITAWLCYIAAFLSLVLYFMLGTMRMVQEAVQDGDIDGAKAYLQQIKFPKLLFKPIRASYYMLQGNLSLASNDLDTAETNIRKSMNTKSSLVGDTMGMNLMQLGFIQLQKGQNKEARKSLMDAVKAGIPDKENLAAAYLQLCSIELQRMQYKIAKEYFRKAKAQKPKQEELVKQIAALEKNLARLPG